MKKDFETTQITGFRVGSDFFGICVSDVQEVVRPHSTTVIPLAEDFIRGLINLRGQIVTAISLEKLFHNSDKELEDHMNVIVKHHDMLFSLVVDEILDVINVEELELDKVPENFDSQLSQYIDGVYKLEDKLISLINLNKVVRSFSKDKGEEEKS